MIYNEAFLWKLWISIKTLDTNKRWRKSDRQKCKNLVSHKSKTKKKLKSQKKLNQAKTVIHFLEPATFSSNKGTDIECSSHCMKGVRIRSFIVRIFPHSDWILRDTAYFSVFSPNMGKLGQKNSKYGQFSCSE